ncbi:MAG: HlyD family secretion protein [Planctomycetota bacterium]|jgi:multidrug resistance efflux pump
MKDIMKNLKSKLPTLVLLIVAMLLALYLYGLWTQRPWTRHGQVRADIVKIAPRVSGYVVEVAVKDNQFVRKGELLFRIDPSSYQLVADKAQVQLQQAREGVAALEAAVKSAEARVMESDSAIVSALAMIEQQEAALANAKSQSARATRLATEEAGSVAAAEQWAAVFLEKKAAVESAKASLSQAKAALLSSKANLEQARANLGEPGEANVRIRQAIVQLERAQLNLSWTSMFAPFDGYITNLAVNEGQFGAPGHPIAAFVDSSSFRVDGYFQESKLEHIKKEDRATITLMTHPDIELTGVVDSIGYAINPPHTASTEGALYLVPQIQPTFEWIRLPQRVPVRIRLENIPENIQLVSGMTASVAIRPARKD